MSTNFHVGSKTRDVIDDSPERTVSRRSSTTKEEEQKLPAKAYTFEAKAKTLSSSTIRSVPQFLTKSTSKIDRISQLQNQSQNAPQSKKLLTGAGIRPASSFLRQDLSIHQSKQQKQNREYSNKSLDNSDTNTEVDKRQILNSEHAPNYQRGKSLSHETSFSSSTSSSSCLAGKSDDYETNRSKVSKNSHIASQQLNILRSDMPQLTVPPAAAAAAAAAAAVAKTTSGKIAVVRKESLLGINISVQSSGPQYQREKLLNFRPMEQYSKLPMRPAQYHNVQTGTGNASRLDSSGKTVECDGPRPQHRYQNVGTEDTLTLGRPQEISKAKPVVNNDNFVRNSSKNKGGTCKAGRPKSALAAKMKRRRDIGDRREQSRDDDRKMAGTYGGTSSILRSQGQWEDQVGF
jgi:hypothetical protein